MIPKSGYRFSDKIMRNKSAVEGIAMPKHVVAAASDIPLGGRKLAQVNGRAVVVFNLGGEFFALNNRCPHRGGSLCDGVAVGLAQSREPGDYQYSRKGEIIRCPWHSWEFDIRTGQSWCDPAGCARANTPCRSSRARRWSRGRTRPRRSRSASRGSTWWWRGERGERCAGAGLVRISRLQIRQIANNLS